MPRPLIILLVFVSVCALEVAWVVSVRLVSLGEVWKVAGWAMMMQTISYLAWLPVVKDRRLTVVGVIAAGVGAVLGMWTALSLS